MGIPPKTLNIELSYDPEIPFLDTCSEKNMIQKDTYNPVFIAALFTKAKKETHRLRKQTSGDRWEGIVTEFGMVMYTLQYLKWITHKGILYSTWNSAQCYVAAWMRGGG